MGKVVVVATILGAAAVCAVGGLIVSRRLKNGANWSRTMDILRDFKEECGTAIEKLKQVDDAMVAQMNDGTAFDNGSRIKMPISYADNLPTGNSESASYSIRMEVEKVAAVVESTLLRYLEHVKWALEFYTIFDQRFDCGKTDMNNIAVTFMANGGLLSLFLGATAKWYPKSLIIPEITKLLSKAVESLSYLDGELVSDWHREKERYLRQYREKSLEICRFIIQINSLVQKEAKEIFQVAKPQLSNTLTTHQSLGVFIDFVRSFFDELLQSRNAVLYKKVSLEMIRQVLLDEPLWIQERIQSTVGKSEDNLTIEMIKLVFLDDPSPIEKLLLSKIGFSQDNVTSELIKLEILKKKTQLISAEMECMEEVREGICFLLTFLSDEPLQDNKSEKVKELWVDIEVIANKAGEICYTIFLDKTDGEVSQALSDLLQKIELTHENIKDYVNAFQPQMSKILRTRDFVMSSTSSLIQDLEDLQEYKTELTDPFKNELKMVAKELVSLESFIMLNKKDVAKNEEDWTDLTSHVFNIIDVAKYLISCFKIQGRPLWYYRIRLFHILEGIKLIQMKINYIEKINKCDDDDGLLEDTADRYDGKSSQHDHSVSTNVMVDSVYETTIKDQLLGGEQKLEFISIVGMPGLGKSTLAKKLCNDPAIVKKFYPCGWSRVSRAYKYKVLLLDLLVSINKLDDETKKMSEGDLAQSLYENLKGSRYLIVLDDIWSTTPWEDCQLCFPDDDCGSRIIFTSRMENLELQGKSHTLYKLPFLSPDDSWFLLKHNVFHNGECPADFEELGKVIAERCQGLPLVLNLIAGLLRTKEKKLSIWEEISNISGAEFGAEENLGEKVLEDIYKHLPPFLKPCMMYCAAFPEQNEIKVQKLMRLWIAEGLIQKSWHESLDKAAEICLTDLINRSLVIVVDRRANGKIKTCIFHSWLHDFFLRKAQEENFLKVIDRPFDTYESHHRLAIVDPTCPDLLTVRPFGPHVRSLLCSYTYHEKPLISNASFVFNGLKLLNVLDLESTYLPSFPSYLSCLILLKYLAIGGDFQYVPSTMGNLWNLETFIVKAPLSCLPDAILGMIKLKHLHIKSEKATLASLYEHESLNLHAMQTLGKVSINSPTDKEVLLSCFRNLRRMKCILSKIQISSLDCFPVLDVLNHLEVLHVTCSFWDGYRYRNDKTAILSFPPSLKELTLSEFGISWSQMSVLAKSLPKLEVLKLVEKAFEGEEWDMDIDEVEFPELKFLKFGSLGIHKWNLSCSADAFPKLERLVIKYCKNLKKIPSSFAENAKLCLIDLQGCSNSAEDSAFQIMEEQHDYGNEKFEVLIRLGH